MSDTRLLASVSYSAAGRPAVPARVGGLVPALLRGLFLATALGLPVAGTSLASWLHRETAPRSVSPSTVEAMR